MKNLLSSVAIAALLASSGAAFAEDLCDVPKADWQPVEALEKKLVAEGWEIRNIKIDDGCYEAYASDQNGDRVEAYFDPETFEVVRMQKED